MPVGQCANGSEMEPAPSVSSTSVKPTGTGRSVPPLNGVGALAKEMNRSASDEAFAFVRSRLPDVFASSVPLPARLGAPELPARPDPRFVHGANVSFRRMKLKAPLPATVTPAKLALA